VEAPASVPAAALALVTMPTLNPMPASKQAVVSVSVSVSVPVTMPTLVTLVTLRTPVTMPVAVTSSSAARRVVCRRSHGPAAPVSRCRSGCDGPGA
jgi:hypothetical protein